ncbi:MAG TPA: carboxypeptidase M32 [Anaerolineales bacterium]|nr:carboxypeptidase M32 [Anaerolineales bacterium]
MANALERFRSLLGEIFDLRATAAVLEWDQQVNLPSGGAANRAAQLSTISRLTHEKFTSDELGAALEAARRDAASLDPDSDDARLVSKVAYDFNKARRVPSAYVAENSRATALAHDAWAKARPANDFAAFRPHLQEVVRLRRAYAEFFAPYAHPYDPMLDDFERGLKMPQVKAVFDELRPRQVALVRAIAERGRPVDNSLLQRDYDVQKQWDFGIEVARAFGFDFDRGRQDKSAHPFTTSFGLGDVRITTRLYPRLLSSSIFSTMHETGHALYEQGSPPELDRTPLLGGSSLAIHESQSRLWENMVGRSLPFWKGFYPRLQGLFPAGLGQVDLETFHRAINKVEPSLIRVEADEATYNLHIMLRFELEIALAEDRLPIADLPAAWNDKMREYLGLTPPNDAQGVLQDVHWSGGILGYFPTYALGNLVAAQLWEKVNADMPDLSRQIERSDFSGLLGWLRTNIHRHGSKFEATELLQRVVGGGLSAAPYLRYLEAKYGEIYGLN